VQGKRAKILDAGYWILTHGGTHTVASVVIRGLDGVCPSIQTAFFAFFVILSACTSWFIDWFMEENKVQSPHVQEIFVL
jgi:hypothetical protein